MVDIVHKPLAAQSRFSGLIVRVLSSTSDESGIFEMPVPPSGSIYLNAMLCGRADFRLSDNVSVEAPSLYFGGQLVKEMPLARIETPLVLVGLQFTATGFYRLFGADASRLTDAIVPLSAVAPRLAERLQGVLDAAAAIEETARVMQGTLAEMLPDPAAPGLGDEVASRIERCSGRIEISELAESCGVTPRHLRRVFAREVGISPKSYAKIVQLNEVVSVLQSGESRATHELALAHGYYDQSHFVRDFSRLVGSNPGRFLSSRDLFLDMFLGKRAR